MKNNTITLVVITLLILIGFIILNKNKGNKAVPVISSYLNTTYKINGQEVKLINGFAEEPAVPGSASKITTTYFGNDLTYVDSNGKNITAFILTQSTGGTGTFYYVVAAVKTATGYIGSDAVLMGDRIAPQTINRGNGNIVTVNFADRQVGESFAVQPSMGKTLWLLLDTDSMRWGQVEPDFTGEADPSRMTLDMKKWKWIDTLYNNDTKVLPNTSEKFTLTLNTNKTFSVTTDCNTIGGLYTVNGNKILFTKISSTQMFCEKSQEANFTQMLKNVESYLFTGKGELILNLKLDSGNMVFN